MYRSSQPCFFIPGGMKNIYSLFKFLITPGIYIKRDNTQEICAHFKIYSYP